MYWKFFRAGPVSPFTRHPWSMTGEWVETEAAHARPCRFGVHACRPGDLPYWLSEELWAVELRDLIEEGDHKVVATAGRLVGRVAGWTAETARRLAVACVYRIADNAAAELMAGGLTEPAARLGDRDLGSLARSAQDVAAEPAVAGRRRAARLCLYIADAAEGLDAWPVATLAYIAARTAGQRSTGGGYDAERAWQADWLQAELNLPG